jgi:hypothetical protein
VGQTARRPPRITQKAAAQSTRDKQAWTGLLIKRGVVTTNSFSVAEIARFRHESELPPTSGDFGYSMISLCGMRQSYRGGNVEKTQRLRLLCGHSEQRLAIGGSRDRANSPSHRFATSAPARPPR